MWLDRQLRDVLEFYALAEGELTPGSSGGGRGSERGLGVRVAALDFLAGHDVVDVLVLWERDWRETYGLAEDAHAGRVLVTLSSCVRFLRDWLPRACDTHPAMDDFAREVSECWGLARAAARCAPATSQTITCPADHPKDETRICGYRIGVAADHVFGRVTCRRCGTEWHVPHLMHVAISTPGAEFWADPEAAAGYFRVDVSTLRRWARADSIRREHGRYEMHSIHLAMRGVSKMA
jgi:hypothetical protein